MPATFELVDQNVLVEITSAELIAGIAAQASGRLDEVEDAIDAFDAAIADAVADAAASAAAADADRIAANGHAVSAAGSATSATNTYNAILAVLAAGAFGPPYLTKADADAAAAAGEIAADALCFVAVDETQNGVPTIRKRVGTATTTTFQTTVFGLATKFQAAVAVSGAADSIGAVLFEAAVPAGRINSGGGDDATPFRIVMTGSELTNGPSGLENYFNYAVGIGFNINQSLGVQNTSMAAIWLGIEQKYYQGIFGTEWHCPQHTPVGAPPGFSWRPHTIFTPQNYSDRYSAAFSHDFTGNTYFIKDADLTPRIQINLNYPGGGQFGFPLDGSGGCVQMVFDKNNQPPILQKNAAGTANLPLPSFDNRDMLIFDAAYRCFGGSPAVGINTAVGYFAEYLDATPRAGGGWLYMLLNAAVAGDWAMQSVAGSASGAMRAFDIFNTNATGGGGGRIIANGNIDIDMVNDGGANAVKIRRNGTTGAAEILTGGVVRLTIAQDGTITIGEAGLNISGPLGAVRVNGQKVVGARQPAISEPSDLASAIASINEMRVALQTFGLTA